MRRLLASALLVLGLVGGGLPGASADTSRDGPSPHRASDLLSVRWSQWVFGVPVDEEGNHPLTSATLDCSYGQTGRVWFLTGLTSDEGSVARMCTVKAGTALFFPIINTTYVGFAGDPPEQRTAAFCYSQVFGRGDVERFTVSASIDGHALSGLDRFYGVSPIFSVQLPAEDNILGATLEDLGGSFTLYPSCNAGFFVYVPPLRVGVHTLHWAGLDEETGFAIDNTYTVTVVR
jgi:hypothetical protein